MNEENQMVAFNGIEMKITSLDDIWLTQNQIAQLFDTSIPNVSMHIKAFLKELDNEQVKSTVKKSLTVQFEGGREVSREVTLYGFEVICQIGYRVNCKRGFQFRQFATKAVMEKVNRNLLNKDETENNLNAKVELLKEKLVEAVMEISDLEADVEYYKQYAPNDEDYGKNGKNGFPRTTYQKAGWKERGGRKVKLRSQLVTIDLIALQKYLTS